MFLPFRGAVLITGGAWYKTDLKPGVASRSGRPRAIGGRVHPLEQRLFHALQEKCGVASGQTGLISLSGGPDSLALLYLLVAVREELGLKLQAIHFDHGLRPESAREAEWVADQVRALGLPIHLRRTDQLKKLGAGLQAEARRWRGRETQAILAAAGATRVVPDFTDLEAIFNALENATPPMSA
ncbi:MAG: hypothetical protein IIA68_10140 [Proteobacteria bacterium]|nr:hypothetical protein [Pseudomonadota bacterium]